MHNMKPTDNDVLSGRGAWYNQHPGNVHFRKIIEEQKDAYMSGTKKQKMNMSKAIVEAIYSMDPPGRFLKECPETGQWNELSKRDAADKAAQAMAYAVSGRERSKQRRERRQQSRQSRRSLPLSLDITNSGGAISSQPVGGPGQHHQLHSSNTHQLESQRSSTADHECEGGAASHTSAAASTASPNNRNINPQQQSPSQLQQPNSSATIRQSSAPGNSVGQHVNQNLLAQALAQALQQQQEHLQRHHDQEEQPRREYGLEELLQMTQQLPPALLERLTQLLFQTQLQQLQQQQVIQQQQLLLQRLLLTNQQNGLPSVSLPTTLSSSAESPASQEAPPLNNLLPSGTSSSANGYSLASPFQLANNSNMFQLLQHQADPSYALLLGMLNNSLQHRSNNIGISGAPEVAVQQTQMALLPNSAMLLQQHLLASLWGAPLNPSLPQQQLQQSVSTLMDPLRQDLNNQAQQQQRHQLLLQCYLNQHQNALQSASLASPIALSAAPFLAATRSRSANNNLLMNLQQAMNASNNTLLLGSMLSDLQQQSNSNAGGVSSTPQISQQIIDRLLGSQMLQQNNQLLASSSLGASSSDSTSPLSTLELQQPLDPLLWQLILQGALPLGHNTQGQGVQPAPIDLNAVVSANFGAPRSTGQKESKDEEQKHKKAS